MSHKPNWRDDAHCGQLGPAGADVFFGNSFGKAREICNRCWVQRECLLFALRMESDAPASMRFGMFGGATPQQRFEIFSRRTA